MRFVTWNVHACVGTDGVFAPPRIRRVLGELNADFIGIQELEDRDFQGETVSAYLARRLGMHAYRGATLKRGDDHYGNLLLSRHRAVRLQTHEISVPGREPRGIVEARYDIGGRRVRVMVTHFGLRAGERRRQASQLAVVARRQPADIDVLMGDFNEWRPASYTVRTLKRLYANVIRHRSWPTRRPLLFLDGICLSPPGIDFTARAVRNAAARQASDHLPLICDVRLSGP